jgi:phenylalanine-4-hydroxylase
VEYGLIGTVENPKIYGAGLCLYWRKRPLHDGSSGEIPYDITAAHKVLISQNLNFICNTNFAYLNLVLEEFANKMALRTGGLSGIEN